MRRLAMVEAYVLRALLVLGLLAFALYEVTGGLP